MSNPKEKAQDIVDKYSAIDWMGYDSDYGYSRFSTKLLNDQAKACAIIHVNGIIDEKQKDMWMGAGERNDPRYWQEVLTEINKL